MTCFPIFTLVGWPSHHRSDSFPSKWRRSRLCRGCIELLRDKHACFTSWINCVQLMFNSVLYEHLFTISKSETVHWIILTGKSINRKTFNSAFIWNSWKTKSEVWCSRRDRSRVSRTYALPVTLVIWKKPWRSFLIQGRS